MALNSSITKNVAIRELKEETRVRFRRSTHVTLDLIHRLGLQAELEGHAGCVNCLTWNEKGSLLASGSDDVQIIIWDPFRHKALSTIRTGHNGNIFSVKFLPHSGDNIIVSAAADCKIRVHDVTSRDTLHVFGCHAGRVKRIATVPCQPHIFYSASEDGTVMEFDLRAPERCKSEQPQNVLINLNEHIGPHAEAKCLSINPLRPELLAVGANDPYIRLYDRRMLHCRGITFPADTPARFARSQFRNSSDSPPPESSSPSPASEEDYHLPDGCVSYFVAGHLPQKQHDYRRKYRTLASTYVTFSPDGTELLVNLGGEQVYLFDINKRQLPQRFDVGIRQKMSPAFVAETKADEVSNGFNVLRHGNGLTAANGVTKHVSTPKADSRQTPPSKRTKYSSKTLPAAVESLKQKANAAFEQEKYSQAIDLYNQAIAVCSDQPILYGNRAAAFLKRSWDGDVYAALRDCFTALRLDVNHMKAHFRLARCLYELSWTSEALDCLLLFKAKFPDNAASKTCETLEKDIRTAIYARTPADGSSATASGSSQNSQSSPYSRWKDSTSLDATSDQERSWRATAYDYDLRFCGHCNTTTDIKEANFFGSNGQYIVAGSDDGSFFIWDKATTNIVRILRGDESIVNCLEPHPATCLLATSGIDPVVRLWSPRPEDGQKNDREVDNSDDAASANQKRMNADPLEVMLSNMGYRISGVMDEEASGERDHEGASVSCRPS